MWDPFKKERTLTATERRTQNEPVFSARSVTDVLTLVANKQWPNSDFTDNELELWCMIYKKLGIYPDKTVTMTTQSSSALSQLLMDYKQTLETFESMNDIPEDLQQELQIIRNWIDATEALIALE